MSGPAPICYSCKRFVSGLMSDKPDSCAAFPDGIPDEIMSERFVHIIPYRSPDEPLFDPIHEYARARAEERHAYINSPEYEPDYHDPTVI